MSGRSSRFPMTMIGCTNSRADERRDRTAYPMTERRDMDIEEKLNKIADQFGFEGLTCRAAEVRSGAIQIARQRHEIERLTRERDDARNACWSAIPWLDELEHLGSLVDHARRKETLEKLRRAVGIDEQREPQ